MFALKKDGTLRFCFGYRKSNAVTKRYSCPILRMDECIDSLDEAAIFSTLDANIGYWQKEIDQADRHKTALTLRHSLHLFIRMPFGLKNAPKTFQRKMDVVLSINWRFDIVYLDDIVTFSKNLNEHIEHIRHVLTLSSNAGVTLKLKKC